MDKIAEVCLALLRFCFLGKEFPEKYKELTEEEGRHLYAFSKQHDIAHLIAVGIDKVGISVSDEVKNGFQRLKLAAAYRSGMLSEEQRKIEELLESEGIRYILLKGAVIKSFYPEDWMRIGSDVDIFVDEENLCRIEKLFEEKFSYKFERKGPHDMGFITPLGVHIEMHYKLIANEEYSGEVLWHVWENVKLSEGRKYRYEMSGEFFVFYHIAHMAKHFKHGGCGLRFYVDYFLIKEKLKYDENKLKELIEKDGLQKFFSETENLINMWMFEEEGSALTKKASEYVFWGGAYGNAKNYATLKQRGKHRKLNYIQKRIFMKREYLAKIYPKINKYPVLVLYYQFVRWLRVLDKSKRKRYMTALKVNLAVTDGEVETLNNLMKELGI